MEKGETFMYRKKEYIVMATLKLPINGEYKIEYSAKRLDDNSLHRFMYNEKGKLYRII